MRSLTQTGATTLMGVLLAGCGAESGPTAVNVAAHAADAATHNTGNHIKVVEPFTEPLVNPCNGEVIVFSGEAVVHVTQVGDRHIEFFTSATGTGTGPESGATYTYHLDAAHENRNSANGQLPNFASGANARIISDLPGLSFTAHFVFHIATLPSGEYKVTRAVDRVECKA
jgi:hypothetical protein